MFSSLLSLGAKYVPSILKTVGTSVGKMLGGTKLVQTIGSKLAKSPILNAGFNAIKTIGNQAVGALNKVANAQQSNAQYQHKQIKTPQLLNSVEIQRKSQPQSDDSIIKQPKHRSKRKNIRKNRRDGRRRKYLK